MIWLALRRQRFTILALTLGALALAVYLIVANQPARAALYHVTDGQSPASCYASGSQSALCQQLKAQWNDTYNDPGDLFGWLGVMLAPAVIGMFLGAPLVAGDLEVGTQRLAWTQSISRRRWLLTLAATQAVIALAVVGVVELATVYWAGATYPPGSNYAAFDVVGGVPLAYTLFALALGLALSALARRTVPAMLLTLVVYLAVRSPIAFFVRPYYLAPLTQTWDPYVTRSPASQPGAGDWTIFSGWIDTGGHPVNQGGFLGLGRGGGPPACVGDRPFQPGPQWRGWALLCTHNNGWHYQDVWQPAGRFWLFQGIESAIFVALAVALVALTLSFVRRWVA